MDVQKLFKVRQFRYVTSNVISRWFQALAEQNGIDDRRRVEYPFESRVRHPHPIARTNTPIAVDEEFHEMLEPVLPADPQVSVRQERCQGAPYGVVYPTYECIMKMPSNLSNYRQTYRLCEVAAVRHQ